MAALLNHDGIAQQRLEAAADDLSQNADENVAMVQLWASEMRPSQMFIRETEAGVEVSVDTPEEVLAAIDVLRSDALPDGEPDAIASRYEVRFGSPGSVTAHTASWLRTWTAV